MAWVSPTGHNDPDNGWDSETNAHDENTGTTAIAATTIAVCNYSKFLELTIGAIDCDKVQFYPRWSGYFDIDLDVYYDGDWQHVYEGSYTSDTWNEKALGATYSVTAARIRFHSKFASSKPELSEFDFWEVPPVSAPTVTTQAADGIGFD